MRCVQANGGSVRPRVAGLTTTAGIAPSSPHDRAYGPAPQGRRAGPARRGRLRPGHRLRHVRRRSRRALRGGGVRRDAAGAEPPHGPASAARAGGARGGGHDPRTGRAAGGPPRLAADPGGPAARGGTGGRGSPPICTGAFVLAAAGLLDGRRAATHWGSAQLLAATFPNVTVDASALYIDEGRILTSAGVAAGADLCLHIIPQRPRGRGGRRLRADGGGAAGAGRRAGAVHRARPPVVPRQPCAAAGVDGRTPGRRPVAGGARRPRGAERAHPAAPLPRADRRDPAALDHPGAGAPGAGLAGDHRPAGRGHRARGGVRDRPRTCA